MVNNKNKILAIFILTLLLASCTKSNIDNPTSETWVSLQEETIKPELFTEEEKEFIEENTSDTKETEIKSIEKELTVTIPKQVTTITQDKNTEEKSSFTTTEVYTSTWNVKEEIKVSEPIDVVKKLAINSKCIWCRHCVKFASSNFAMDNSSGKAIVISQENLDSTWVARAIGRCPVSAISIS